MFKIIWDSQVILNIHLQKFNKKIVFFVKEGKTIQSRSLIFFSWEKGLKYLIFEKHVVTLCTVITFLKDVATTSSDILATAAWNWVLHLCCVYLIGRYIPQEGRYNQKKLSQYLHATSCNLKVKAVRVIAMVTLHWFVSGVIQFAILIAQHSCPPNGIVFESTHGIF